MISYITIGVKDMEQGLAFWTNLLKPLGASVFMNMDRIAFIGESADKPMLSVCTPYNEEAPHPGNGNMIALPAGSREKVDEMYARALELGATDDGPPGERMPGFYAGYFRDPDGNKAAFIQMG